MLKKARPTRKSGAFITVIAVLVAWALVPAVRAVGLVARHDVLLIPMDAAGLALENVGFVSSDGIALSGWLHASAPSAPAVVLVHGFKTARDEMLPWARFLADAGYALLLFDLRGCGNSGGNTIGLGATEARDISAAVRYLYGRSDLRPSRVGVLGISLGAGAAILAAADDPTVAAVVADSAWADQDFQLERLDRISVGAVSIPVLPYSRRLLDRLVGADVEAARPRDKIGRISPRPVLLIHSADDANATTPLAAERELFLAAQVPKTEWVVPLGGHVGAILAYPDEYRKRVLAFLSGSLR